MVVLDLCHRSELRGRLISAPRHPTINQPTQVNLRHATCLEQRPVHGGVGLDAVLREPVAGVRQEVEKGEARGHDLVDQVGPGLHVQFGDRRGYIYTLGSG